ncbi:hypothetical protein OKA05_25580 [Luteolibacter arcticus]|uniref:Uncharacterized protein n=1 Tax=Luteolibacter arcticus TaxID=1581411 RepID=A0ABT3GQZ5_9BACT|nr:hypothetical protein [Luteolibacter arcticus]MCW1925956.1 hypothetical protein [Luteolibacter arcticus]
MSAEPQNPSGLPGRNRPQLSDLSRETTEDDLWNLDEEAAPGQSRQAKPTPSPRPISNKEAATEPESTPGTVEPPAPRGLHSPVKPPVTRSTPADEIGDLDESEPEPAPKRTSKPIPGRPPAPAPSPPPADETISLTSAIDEEPAEPPAPVGKQQKKRAKKKPAGSEVTAAPQAAAPPVVEELELELYQPEPEAAPEPEPEPEPAPEPYDAGQEEEPAPAVAKENRPRPAAPATKGNIPRPRMNRREVIGIASFVVVVMITALWVLTRFFSQLSFTSDSEGLPDYPLKGNLAWIASGSTFWREPVRSGDTRDVARREVVLIPVLELTLDPEHSGGGALRVLFRNGDGEPLGDPITRSFGAGRFESSGSATVAFAATDGFTEDGDFQSYRTGKGNYWTADVLEGPPGDSPASSFKKISSIPIFPDRR